MLKKKKLAKNVKKEPPQKTYTLITLEEKRAREIRFHNRLMDMRSVLNFYEEALRDMEQQEAAREKQEEWEEYLRCEGLPKPYSPPDIRLYFVQKRFVEAEIVRDTLDWLLNVDERSILTQDIFAKDMTRNALVKELRPEFGSEYNQSVDDSLKILKRLQYFLADKNLVNKVSPRILKDIQEQPTFVQQEILEFIDRYAYRILCSENSYMEHIDDIAAEYSFAGNNFSIHIWALKHVPINFDPADFPSVLADLSELHVQLQIPFSVLADDIAIRGVHFKFDHFSEHVKSFTQQASIPTSSINAMIPDLNQCLSHEWAMQNELENEVRNKMIALRSDYEEKMKLIEDEATRKKKDKNKDEKKKEVKIKAPKKAPKEQPLITESLFPDIWEDFLKKEQKQFDDFIDLVYHPNVLNLHSYEINMKEYIILGGVYQMVFVSKPNHTSFSSFTMTWHKNNGNLYLDKEVKANLEADYSKLHKPKTPRMTSARMTARYSEAAEKRRTTMMMMSTRHKSTMDMQDEEEENINVDKFLQKVEMSPYFVVTFDLPMNLCLWGEPQPCHFEADMSSLVEIVYPEAETRETLRYARATMVEQDMYNFVNQMANINVPTPSTTTLNVADPGAIVVDGAIQKIPSFTIQVDEKKPSVGLNTDGVELENFSIHLPMTKGQIRTLQRHCIPRIISSLKFPVELAEEENELSRTKSRGLGGTLVRKRQSEGEDNAWIKPSERIFSNRLQNNPERFFPIYSQVDSILMPFTPEEYAAMIGQYEPETFFELVTALDTLKKFYQERYMKMFELPLIVSKVRKKRHQHQAPAAITEAPATPIPADTKYLKKSMAKPIRPKDIHRGTRFLETHKSEIYEDYNYEDDLPEEKQITYAHWTKKHIFHSVFNRENRKLMIWTDRIGTIGLAYKRYEHFPFRYWSLEPSEKDPEKEVVFTIHTQFAKCVIFISAKGYCGYVTRLDLETKLVRDHDKYLDIKEPLRDLKDLIRLLSENNLNIFSQNDARYYIENGYFCEKHLAAEIHCYTCMAVHCALIKFRFSEWNRFAERRDIIFQLLALKDSEENINTVRISPEAATFVEIEEKCEDNLQDIQLEYTLTWKNLDNYSDLHNMLASTYPAAIDMRVRDPNLIFYVRNFLREIRPLSYS